MCVPDRLRTGIADVHSSVHVNAAQPGPNTTGDLSMAHWLEGAGPLSVGVGGHGAGNYNFSLGVTFG
jgi:hypothetical protein